ncbi:MAG: prepilin-type N-terminal cleavage/methylation domain-containing protein [Puniceicoccales bacterium]|jgi:type II secretory pathway pseudopilin PulG|nr:prepilin-type N-terminal cleavage/methylation domain-containing protein [Puniceicoccales bacterium]
MEKRKSFTLVEIVFTVSIIGILLAILLPAMSAIKLSAKKVKDLSNLQKIAEAWRECVINRGWTIDGKDPDNPSSRGISVFQDQLGGRGKTNISDMVLNDPYIYISPGDKYASKIIKETITQFNNEKVTYTQRCSEAAVTNFMISNGYIISYCFAMDLPAYVPLNTTPLGFTRGLREDGKWDEKAGLYGSKGGYVIYADGHVTWFEGDKPAKFLKWDKSGYTSDIRETVPNSTWITCTNDINKVKAAYKGENSLAIICQAGTGGE